MEGDACEARPASPLKAEAASRGTPYKLDFQERLTSLFRKPFLDVQVADHCNLRCAGCLHFAPLASPRFLNLDAYERELNLLGGVDGIGSYFEAVMLMGGEPLLNPQLPDVVRLTRRYLPDATVVVASNGLLLKRMGDVFWQALSSCDAWLFLSPYPIGVNYEALLELAETHGVRAVFAGDVTGAAEDKDKDKDKAEDKEAFFHLAIDPAGNCDPSHSFSGCPFGGRYLLLRDGALWPCQVGGLHGTLNERFGCALQSSPADCLALEEVTSTQQIEVFRRRPHPMCRYCDNDRLAVTAWQRSKLEASEWLV